MLNVEDFTPHSKDPRIRLCKTDDVTYFLFERETDGFVCGAFASKGRKPYLKEVQIDDESRSLVAAIELLNSMSPSQMPFATKKRSEITWI